MSLILIRKNRYLVTLALVSSRRNSRSRAQTSIFTIENQHLLVQMAQAWPGPAQARPGPDFGNLGTWKSRNLESKKISKMEILKIQIHVAQNVGKVWIGRKKTFPAPFGAIPGNFSMDRKNQQKKENVNMLPIFLGGPMGPIHPVWGHVLVSYLKYMEAGHTSPKVGIIGWKAFRNPWKPIWSPIISTGSHRYNHVSISNSFDIKQ